MAITVIPGYLVRVILPYFVMAVGIFSAILFMNQFVRVFNTAVLLGASLSWIFYSLIQLLPGVLALSVPMAFLLAVLLAFTGLSEQGEIMALRAAGFSFYQIVRLPGLLAVLLSGILLLVNNWVSPLGFKKFQDSRHLLAESITKLKIEPKTFVNIGEWKLYAEEAGDSGKLGRAHLFRYNSGDKASWTVRISAPDGTFALSPGKGIALELNNGEFQRTDPYDSRKITLAKFEHYSAFLPFRGKPLKERELSLTEQTTPEILARIKKGDLVEQRDAEYKIEAATRFAVGLSPLILFWVGCPLGLGGERRNRAWGMIFSIVIMFAYYGAMACGVSIGKKFHSLAWWAPWLPDIVGIAAGAAIWKKRLER